MNQPANTEMPKTWPMFRAMGGIGLLCGVLIVATYQITLPVIEGNKAEFLEQAIFNVLPGAVASETFLLTPTGDFDKLETEDAAGEKIYAGYDSTGDLIGVAIEARGMGFQDAIVVLYGYAPEREIVVGIQVLESRETPGLGDKIEKDPDFLRNFDALDVALAGDAQTLANPIVPVKKGEKQHPWEIDAITGATISSNAIAAILRESTTHWVPKVKEHLNAFQKGR